MSDFFDIETIGDVGVLHVRDAGALEFEQIPLTSQAFDEFIDNPQTDKLVVDCGQVEFWSSLALGVIVSKSARAERAGKRLKYCNIHPKSMWSIQASRLHTVLDICYDLDQALAEF